MDKQIIWTQSAHNDLENIFAYIRNSDDAKSRISILITSIEKLTKFPLNVTKYYDIPGTDYYEMKHSAYKIIIKSIDDKVYILAIVHSSIS